MRPADLLNFARNAAPPAIVRTVIGAADAFGRALKDATAEDAPAAADTETARPDRTGLLTGQAGGGHALPGFLSGDHAGPRAQAEANALAGLSAGDRADAVAGFGLWRDFRGTLRELGLMMGPRAPIDTATGKVAGAGETALTSPISTPKVPNDAADPLSPFATALDALGAAIQAALADPAANTAPTGQLPPLVQTALDTAVAAAPPILQARIQAFAVRLADRLATAMAGGTDETGKTAGMGEAPAADGATPANAPVTQALAAALNNPANGGATGLAPSEDKTTAARGDAASSAETTDAAESTSRDEARTATPASADKPARDARPDSANARPETTAARAEPAADNRAAPAAVADASEPSLPAEATRPAAAPIQATPAHVTAQAAVRGAPELVAQLAASISRKLEGRTTRFNMELNPAEMGRVDVKLSIDHEGRIAAQMAFDNPAAAADMRGKADELRRQLEQAGFNVASEDLTFTDRETGQGFTRQEQRPAEPETARAFRDADRTARLAEDAGRLSNRAVLGLDMRV